MDKKDDKRRTKPRYKVYDPVNPKININPRINKIRVYDPVSRKMVEKAVGIINKIEAPSLFGKSVTLMFLIFIQIIAIVGFYVLLLGSYRWIYFAAQGLSLLTCFRVLSSNKNSDSKIAWIVFLLALSLIGFIIYFFWGELSTSPFKRRRMKKIDAKTEIYKHKGFLGAVSERVNQECSYAKNASGYAPHALGEAEYFSSGEALFEDMLDKLKTAEKFIFIEFFIIKEGKLLDVFMNILEEKAKADIDIRIIYDGFGSNDTLSRKTIKKIRKAGIKIFPYEKVYPIVNFFMNYRDHRKIVVIDGKMAYTGGANLADEYVNIKKRYGFWKDTGIRIEGGAVDNFTLMFLRMWEFVSKKELSYEEFLNLPQNAEVTEKEYDKAKNNILLPYCDGPDNDLAAAKGIYNCIIANSKRYLYVMTPYFIVDDTVTEIIKSKAMGGIDVRIIIPGIPDKRYAYALTRSNAERLLKSGVKVYIYTPGFLHSKVMLSDDECAVVGSVNMDFRSYYQQYESAVYTTNQNVIKSVLNDFENTFPECCEIVSKPKRNIVYRFLIALLRLFAPLM